MRLREELQAKHPQIDAEAIALLANVEACRQLEKHRAEQLVALDAERDRQAAIEASTVEMTVEPADQMRVDNLPDFSVAEALSGKAKREKKKTNQ